MNVDLFDIAAGAGAPSTTVMTFDVWKSSLKSGLMKYFRNFQHFIILNDIFECWLFRHCSRCGCSFHHCYDFWTSVRYDLLSATPTTRPLWNGRITLLLKDSSIFPNLRFQFQSFFLIFDWFFTKSLSLIGNNLIKKVQMNLN